ncbi:MAG TPA: hypothetical protein VIK86_04775 [Candidatus Paceibacterota bacterium]
MKRLTCERKYKNGRRAKGNWEATTHTGANVIYAMTDRLAEYEDIGLTPEEILLIIKN